MAGWSLVPVAKLGSWFLLLLIGYALVAIVNRPKAIDEALWNGGQSQPVST